MSFALIITMVPQIIEAINSLDGLLADTLDAVDNENLDPKDAEDLAKMLAQKQKSQAKRDEALDKLKAAIEAKRAQK